MEAVTVEKNAPPAIGTDCVVGVIVTVHDGVGGGVGVGVGVGVGDGVGVGVGDVAGVLLWPHALIMMATSKATLIAMGDVASVFRIFMTAAPIHVADDLEALLWATRAFQGKAKLPPVSNNQPQLAPRARDTRRCLSL